MQTTRRHLLAAGATLLTGAGGAWLGYRYTARPPILTIHRPGMAFGHQLRDQRTPSAPHGIHYCDTLILGSGAAGLAAAWQLSRQGHHNYLLLDGPERNGNNAGHYTHGLGAPSGAHYLALPSSESTDVRDLLADLRIMDNGQYRESDLVHAPAERLFYHNRWQAELLPYEDADTSRFDALIRQLKQARGSDGRKLFAIPIVHSSQDPHWRTLDHLSFAQWLAQENYRSPSLLWYLDYCCRDDYGQGLDAVSAFAGLHYFAARGHDDAAVLTWPDGLAHLSDAIRAHTHMQPLAAPPVAERWHFSRPASLNASAIHITEKDTHVEVLIQHHDSKRVYRIDAAHVISALPLHVAARIVAHRGQYGLDAPLPASAPWLIGNFLCTRFPREVDHAELAWDNVIHGSAALGYIHATHQFIRVAKPPLTLFTTYSALNHAPPSAVRAWLLTASDDELFAHAAQDLVQVYGKRFLRHVPTIDLTLRAHGMAIPAPGYLALLPQLRAHHSRLTFAHSDMSGYSVFEEAVYWGAQAARKRLQDIHT